VFIWNCDRSEAPEVTGKEPAKEKSGLPSLTESLSNVFGGGESKEKEKLILQLSKKLETLLMDNEDLRDQNDRLNTRLIAAECEKTNMMASMFGQSSTPFGGGGFGQTNSAPTFGAPADQKKELDELRRVTMSATAEEVGSKFDVFLIEK
jgi:hypothetical protein